MNIWKIDYTAKRADGGKVKMMAKARTWQEVNEIKMSIEREGGKITDIRFEEM